MTYSTPLRTAGALATCGLVLAALIAPPAAFASPVALGHTTSIAGANDSDVGAGGEAGASEDPGHSEDPGQTGDPGDGQGEVVYDGPFITPTPDTTPNGAVLGATATPEMTPPSTDVPAVGATAAGGGLQLLLLALASLTFLLLVVGRVTPVRRS